MPTSRSLIDDRLLIARLVGERVRLPRIGLGTTSYWYYRACRAAALGAGGHLSGPFERLAPADQRAAIGTLLELRDDIGLPDPRATVPLMVQLAARYERLNLLNLEAAAAARVLSATVWLSESGAAGVLPEVLDAEGVRWSSIAV